MQISKIIAAALSLVLLGGVAAAIAKGGEHAATVARESVCTSKVLSLVDRNSCVAQMAAATTQVAKQEVATRFQSKIDTREAVEAAKIIDRKRDGKALRVQHKSIGETNGPV